MIEPTDVLPFPVERMSPKSIALIVDDLTQVALELVVTARTRKTMEEAWKEASKCMLLVYNYIERWSEYQMADMDRIQRDAEPFG